MVANPHILVIEDDADVGTLIRTTLESDGAQVTWIDDGAKGLAEARSLIPDLILLDRGLPSLRGTDICRELKQDPGTRDIPVIFLTAQADEADIVLGLELGSEDYVKKPFSPKELVARVRAVLRRTTKRPAPPASANVLRHGPLLLDRGRFETKWDGQPLSLTQSEFHILWLLAEQPGIVSSRERLIHAVSEDTTVVDRTIDVHIASIRKKLGNEGRRIVTVRGVGYKWVD